MVPEVKSTRNYLEEGVNILVYGGPGVGKTWQMGTLAPAGFSPLLLDVEGGLLTLASKGIDLPYVTIRNLDDLANVISWLKTPEADCYDTVCLDSISELSKIILADSKLQVKDGRQAYGMLKDTLLAIVKSLCNLPKNLYVTAQIGKVQDDTGRVFFGASTEGQQVAPQLEYIFSEVFVARSERDKDGNVNRFLQTIADGQYSAKDRSSKLAAYEYVGVGEILRRIVT